MSDFKQKPVLRRGYESIAGVVSDRQWLRIRNELGIDDQNDLTALEEIGAYASLRVMFPRSVLDPISVNQYRLFAKHFPLNGCTGKDLLLSAQRVLKPAPSDRTVRGWGYEIGCPLYLDKWYNKRELLLWTAKFFSQRKFKCVLTMPKARQVQSMAF